MRNVIKTAALAIVALVAATSNVQAQGIYQHDIEGLWQEGMVQVEQYNQTLDYYHQLYDRYDWSRDEYTYSQLVQLYDRLEAMEMRIDAYDREIKRLVAEQEYYAEHGNPNYDFGHRRISPQPTGSDASWAGGYHPDYVEPVQTHYTDYTPASNLLPANQTTPQYNPPTQASDELLDMVWGRPGGGTGLHRVLNEAAGQYVPQTGDGPVSVGYDRNQMMGGFGG